MALAPWQYLDSGKEKSDVTGWNVVFLTMPCKTFNNTIHHLDTFKRKLYPSQGETRKDSVLTYVGWFLMFLAQSYESTELTEELDSLTQHGREYNSD